MADVVLEGPQGRVDGADPPGGAAPAVGESGGLGEEAVVVVHEAVPDEVIRDAQRPQPALLNVVGLVVVCPRLLAVVLLRTQNHVVDYLVLHLVSVLDVDARAFDVIQDVRFDAAAVGAVHDDAPLGGVFNGVAEEEARGACAGLVEVKAILARHAQLPALFDPRVGHLRLREGVRYDMEPVPRTVKIVPGDGHGTLQVEHLGLHASLREAAPGCRDRGVQREGAAGDALHREHFRPRPVPVLRVAGGGGDGDAVSRPPPRSCRVPV